MTTVNIFSWDIRIYKLNALYENISYTNNDVILSVMGKFLSSDSGGVTMTVRYDRDAMIAVPALQEAGKPRRNALGEEAWGMAAPVFRSGPASVSIVGWESALRPEGGVLRCALPGVEGRRQARFALIDAASGGHSLFFRSIV
ncbi:hypothetical protein [Asaia spathodeae]|uniref:hypothetical protein n=1 Tax=Asaia spathodeae TaxID=657016 RepID=UPI002FC2D973